MDAIVKLLRWKRTRLMEDINYLDGQMALPKGALESLQSDLKEVEQAVAILESYPRWQPLIEAAKKCDRQECLEVLEALIDTTTMSSLDDIYYRDDGAAIFPIAQIRSLLEALPEAPDA